MVKIGHLKNFRQAKQMLEEGGYEVTEKDGLVKKLFVNGEEVLSIAQFGSAWIFRYNPNYFAEPVN